MIVNVKEVRAGDIVVGGTNKTEFVVERLSEHDGFYTVHAASGEKLGPMTGYYDVEVERGTPLAERCTFWLRGEQCPERRVSGSTRCALHDAGKRYEKQGKE